MKRLVVVLVAMLALAALPAFAGAWHAGTTNFCADCHTMHFSQSHNWDGTTPVSTTAVLGGNWLSASGPNTYLLKAPANQLCESCHDGQTFAPDVVEANTNAASYTQGRSAGALHNSGTAGYGGHELGSTNAPPGLVGTWYNAANGLECISCHAQHGSATSYRNLGSYEMPGGGSPYRPTYVVSTTNDTTKDVWVNQAAYTGGTGNPANFGPYYDNANTSYNRNDKSVTANGETKLTSNTMDVFCSACHGTFHGGTGDTNIGGVAASQDGFIRHPTSQVNIGSSTSGGHSSLAQYAGTGTFTTTTRVKVYTNDKTNFTNSSPGCITCHKSHGNQNPFGLVFLNRNAAAVSEEGGFKGGQPTDYTQGYKNLCGQCHGQASAN